jgi:protein TonB
VVSRRCFSFIFSLVLHIVVVFCLFAFAQGESREQEQVFHVSLENFFLAAGHGAAPAGRTADEREAESKVEDAAESGIERVEKQGRKANSDKKAVSGRTKRQSPAKEPGNGSASPSGSNSAENFPGAASRFFSSGVSEGGVDNGVHDVSLVDEKPSVLRRIKPEYPEKARKMRIDGTVVVRLVVDAEGLPTDCAVHTASPMEYFEDAALEAARKTRFLPGRLKGRPVRTLVLLPFDFRLK